MSQGQGRAESLALSEQQKDAVKKWVPKARRLLEEEYLAQLDRLGLKSDGHHVAVEKMHLSDDALRTRTRVAALLARDSVAEGTPEGGYANVQREFAYTLLNRLLGLKTMEARSLLYLPPPAESAGEVEQTEILTLVPGQVYSRFLRDLRAAGGSRYKYGEDAEELLLKDGLGLAFRHVTRDIGVLFDPDHEYASVWPTYGTLKRIIGMINDDLSPDVYRAPDFLGWVYQFFRQNENRELREVNGGTPRTSYELAVMNQFYTPGWVVKALVDNTLGRLWFQMHPNSALVGANVAPQLDTGSGPVAASYLVPNTGEKIRYERMDEDGHRITFKRASDIALLDPACGTMHFGQYAFGLFFRMYVEEITHAGEAGWPDEPSVRELKDIPASIVERNLFGIDIDPRAIQIASLSLMLTAKETALAHGLSPLDVHIRRSNLVLANAVNLGPERMRKLVERIGSSKDSGPLRERLFTAVWDNLRYVGELGSLIQIHESVSEVLGDWVRSQIRSRNVASTPRQPGEQRLGDLDPSFQNVFERDREDLEREATRLESEVVAVIEAAAAEASDDPGDRIFAEDTARGLKLIQALGRRYDIVVMNPPYGAFVPKVKGFVKTAYPLTSNDIYAAFIDRATQLTYRESYIGALVPTTFVANKTHERLRTHILLNRNPLIVMLDLGFGILEATVETAAIVLRGGA